MDFSDVASLAQAGVTPRDVQDVVTDIRARVVVPVPSTTVVSTSVSGYSWDVTHFVNDINRVNTQVLAEYGASGALTADYTYGLGRVDVRATGVSGSTEWLTDGTPMTGWYLPDGRGSVAGVVRSGSLGSVEGPVSSYSYDPWGVPSSAGVSSTYGWNAELYSPVTGLQFLQSRWYEPTSGRFVSPDRVLGSVSQSASWNRYAYAWDDPVNRVDPTGTWPQFLTNLVSNIGSAVTSAASTVVSGLKSAASWVNTKLVQPAVKVVSTAATWVGANVVKPAVNWFNTNIVKPASTVVSNATTVVTQVAQTVASSVAGAAVSVVHATEQAVVSAAVHAQQVVQQLTAKAHELACTTANKLSDAWQWVKQAASQVDWGMIGGMAAGIGATALCLAVTVGVGSLGCIVLGGVVGGAIGGGIGYTQATAGTDSFSWGGLALTMGVGAVAGGLGGLAGAEVGSLVGSTAGSMIGSTAGDLLGNVAGGMAAGATTCGVSALLMGQSLSKDELGQCVLVGGAAAGVMSFAGKVTPMVKPSLAKPTAVEPVVEPSAIVEPGATVQPATPNGTTGGVLYHYTSQANAALIQTSGQIHVSSDGYVYLTPDVYESGAQAQALLAMKNTPGGRFEIPESSVAGPSTPAEVKPLNGQPGGGIEVKSASPVPVKQAVWVPFGDPNR